MSWSFVPLLFWEHFTVKTICSDSLWPLKMIIFTYSVSTLLLYYTALLLLQFSTSQDYIEILRWIRERRDDGWWHNFAPLRFFKVGYTLKKNEVWKMENGKWKTENEVSGILLILWFRADIKVVWSVGWEEICYWLEIIQLVITLNLFIAC